jgi:hypothetical protein
MVAGAMAGQAMLNGQAVGIVSSHEGFGSHDQWVIRPQHHMEH